MTGYRKSPPDHTGSPPLGAPTVSDAIAYNPQPETDARDARGVKKDAHTPGPWCLESDPYEDGTPYFRISAGDPYGDPEMMGFEISAIMREADARLIVSAPELLALVEAFVAETVDYMTLNNLGNPEGQHNIKWARNILTRIAVFQPRVPAVNRVNCRVMMTDKHTGWNFVFGPMTLAAAATYVARMMRRSRLYLDIRIVGDVA